MEYLENAIKVFIAICIINVWLFRFSKSTPWRGGEAKNMKQEFAAYGLPEWFMIIIGAAKVILSLVLLVSIYYKQLELFGAYGIAVLMIGAIFMHLNIKDPLKKSFPAFIFLVLSLALVAL